MYTKEEGTAIKQKFWTALGKYMHPVPNANGNKINWINYKTGIRGIGLKMDVDQHLAVIYIEISTSNSLLQMQYYQLFLQHQVALDEITLHQFTFHQTYINSQQKTVAAIVATLPNVTIHDQACWPSIISFFKAKAIQIDTFWETYKVAFEML